MDLSVRHTTTYHYTSPTTRVALLLRLLPMQFDGQAVSNWDVKVNDQSLTDFSANSRGDLEAHFQTMAPQDTIIISASGHVKTEDRHGLVKGLARDVPPAVFLRSTPLTRADDAICALAAKAVGGDLIARLHALSALVREAVAYRAGVTNAETSAAQSLALGRGVCQDHAHVFCSAARSLGIPARYVVGYYMAGSDEDGLHETHGWAEAYVDTLGWVAFDVTNGVCATEYYVRLCCGMDAHDAAPIRGAVLGGSHIAIDADVLISEAEALAEHQMQPQQ
jgi:transglutaminase-like putative cysteine protease